VPAIWYSTMLDPVVFVMLLGPPASVTRRCKVLLMAMPRVSPGLVTGPGGVNVVPSPIVSRKVVAGGAVGPGLTTLQVPLPKQTTTSPTFHLPPAHAVLASPRTRKSLAAICIILRTLLCITDLPVN